MNTLYVKIKRKTYAVPFDEIVYMTSNVRKVTLDTLKGELCFYGTLNKIMQNMDERFMHCHKSYIINMDKINEITDGKIVMQDGSEIFMGRDCSHKAEVCFKEYCSKYKIKFGNPEKN